MMRIRGALALILAIVLLALPACSAPSKLNIATAEPTAETQVESATEEKPKIDGHAVDSPYGEMPQYIFDHEPTVDEMRAAAVDLMRTALTVQWYTPQDFSVSTSVSESHFIAKKNYAGIPYTGPNTSIYGFLEYLDPETGRLLYEDLSVNGSASLGQTFEGKLGSSCSGTAGWAIAAVCSSVHGLFQSYYMVYQNGWLPLGEYTYDLSTLSFGLQDSKDDTESIVARYGEQTMYRCYALLQPADIVVWQNTEKLGHTMMAQDCAVVIMNDDGTINGENSYVMIQDQRFGDYPQTDKKTGHVYIGQGRVDCKYTFSRLFAEGYIPMTTAEFQGKKPYEYPTVSANAETVTDLKELEKVTVTSNYPMATVALYAENKETGEKDRLTIHIFTRNEINSGAAMAYSLKSIYTAVSRNSKIRSGSFHITIVSRSANGQLFTPLEFDYIAQA